MLVPLYALWVDGANVVVADVFADGPLAVLAWIRGVGLLDVLGVVIGEGDGGDAGGGCGGGLRDQMSLLSLLRLARTHTRHG